MTVCYFVINLIISLIFLIFLFQSLIQYSDANWGGILSFIFPLPPLIVYIRGLILSLRKRIRNIYTITFNI